MDIGMVLRDRLETRMDSSQMPKYVHLVEVIEELVRNGTLAQGFQFPAESVIAQKIPMSLGTIQKAMSVLQKHGIVSREHGRGTFVRGIPAELRDLWHFRFLADDGRTILPVYPRIVEVSVVDEAGPWNEFLNNEERCVRITRVIAVNREFNVVSEYYVSHHRCEGLLSMPLEQLQQLHLRDVLREQFGLSTVRVVEQVSCETLPQGVPDLLGMASDSLGLVCRLLAFDYRDAPVSYHVIHVPPNKRRLEMRERKPA